jgi:Thiamine transporter protein (Thia_YuaJ)
VRLRGRRGADPLNLIRVMPAQGDLRISYRRIPVDRKEDAQLNAFRDTRVLTEAALALALAFVLGFVVLFKMPFGGTVSLEMIPLILLALRQGWKVGVVAGAAYGLLDLAAIDPFVASQDSSSRRCWVRSLAPQWPFWRASHATSSRA